MTSFFSRNLSFSARMARGVAGAICLIAGIILADFDLPACLVLVGLGLFAMCEAVCAWSLVRACVFRHKRAAEACAKHETEIVMRDA